MHKNPLWLAFLGLVLLATSTYIVIAVYRYYQYSLLTAHTAPLSIEWTIKEKKSDQFFLEANYRFLANNTPYTGSTAWSKETHLNQLSAEYSLKEYASRNWDVWYNPENPSHSSLQKDFPFKDILSALILLGLFFYFLWIGFYVVRFKT